MHSKFLIYLSGLSPWYQCIYLVMCGWLSFSKTLNEICSSCECGSYYVVIIGWNNYHLLLTNENLKSTTKISLTHHPTMWSSIQGRPIHARRDGDSPSHDYLGVGIQKTMAITAKNHFCDIFGKCCFAVLFLNGQICWMSENSATSYNLV